MIVMGYYLVHDMVSDGSQMAASKVIVICTDLAPCREPSVSEIFTFAMTQSLVRLDINRVVNGRAGSAFAQIVTSPDSCNFMPIKRSFLDVRHRVVSGLASPAWYWAAGRC
jgi:hypothetical protein